VRDALQKCRVVCEVIFACTDQNTLAAFSAIISEMGDMVTTAEEWNPSWQEVPVTERDYWVNVYGMLQQHWALVEPRSDGGDIFFINDSGGVFDKLELRPAINIGDALIRNGFERWGPSTEVAAFIPLPRARPHLTFQEPVYSNGIYWK